MNKLHAGMLNEMFKAASFAHCGNVDFKNKARNTAFDFIKGLAITSVVMGHTRAFSNVMPFFNLWHVGAFFIIAGWFFSAKSWDDIGNAGLFLWKKTKRIWWPFVLWCSLFIIFHNFLFALNVFSSNTDMAWMWLSPDYYRIWSLQEVVKRLPPVLLLKGNACQLGQLWFLRVLFFASVFYCLLGRVLTLFKLNRLFWLSCAALLSLCSARYYYPRPLSTVMGYAGGKPVLMAFPLIHLGWLLRSFRIDYSNMGKREVACWGTVCFIVLLTLMSIGSITYSRCQFPSVCFLLLAALSGFYFAMALSFLPVVSPFFAYVGRFSMSILIFHFLAYDLIDAFRVMLKGLPWEYMSAFPILPADWRWGVCYVVAGIGIPILLNRIFVHFSCGFNVLFRQFKRFKHEVVRP